MSRRSQITRTSGAAAPAEPVADLEVFTWNAMLTATVDDEVATNETKLLTTDWPFHHVTPYDFDQVDPPAFQIVVPRDGIYSMSARVYANCESAVAGLVGLNAHTGSYVIDSEMRPLTAFDADIVGAWLVVSHAGWPFVEGDHIWIDAENRTAMTVTMRVESFSVTYEAELGIVTPPGGGG